MIGNFGTAVKSGSNGPNVFTKYGYFCGVESWLYCCFGQKTIPWNSKYFTLVLQMWIRKKERK